MVAAAEGEKSAEVKSAKAAHLDNALKQESQWLCNLFVLVRETRLTADPDELFARYRAEPEKVKHGIMWPQGDDDAQRVLQRFFRKESALRRLQLLFAEKLKKEGKYRHLNLFGFFL
jgi:hypothetical protein